jgi:hypothetical protein
VCAERGSSHGIAPSTARQHGKYISSDAFT